MWLKNKYSDASGKPLTPGSKVQCFMKNDKGELKPNVKRGVGEVIKVTTTGVQFKVHVRAATRVSCPARDLRLRPQFPPSNPDAQAFDQHAIDAAGLRVLTPSKRARAGSGQWTGGGLPKAAPGRSVSAASAEPRIVEGASESDEEEEGLFMSVWRCC